MIKLTRLDGSEFILNAHLIKYVERTPDTIVTLRDGERLMVREPPDEVVRRAIDYRRSIQILPGRQ